jgi:hypothetical protein
VHAYAEDENCSPTQGRARIARISGKPPVLDRVYLGHRDKRSGWDYYYSFRPSDPKSRWDAGPYNELATISFGGEIIRPQDSKYKRAKVIFSARLGMMEENGVEPPKTIGSLTANDEELSAYIFIPAERTADLAAVAQSGRAQVVHFPTYASQSKL